MGRYPWFRTYSDELNDVSMNRLSDRLYRTFKKLECLANLGDPRGRLPDDEEDLDEIAHRIRQTPSKTRKDLEELEQLGLLERDPKTNRLMPSGWDDMQKKSDSSAPRVAAHRARKQAGNVTDPLRVTGVSRDMSRSCNALEEEEEDVDEDPDVDGDPEEEAEEPPEGEGDPEGEGVSAAHAAAEVPPSASLQAAPSAGIASDPFQAIPEADVRPLITSLAERRHGRK